MKIKFNPRNSYIGNVISRYKRQRKVIKVHSVEELKKLAKDLGFTYFLNYDANTEVKRREFRSAINFFNIDLSGKCVLDIGPGTSDSLV